MTIDLAKTRDRSQRDSFGFLDNYVGHRAKIGVIIPSTNISVEYDCQQIVPPGVVWNFGRFFIEHHIISKEIATVDSHFFESLNPFALSEDDFSKISVIGAVNSKPRQVWLKVSDD